MSRRKSFICTLVIVCFFTIIGCAHSNSSFDIFDEIGTMMVSNLQGAYSCYLLVFITLVAFTFLFFMKKIYKRKLELLTLTKMCP